MEGSIQNESMKSSKGRYVNNDEFKRNDSDLEHKRQLLLEILRQRKIFTDSETGNLINDNTNIRTRLNIIQIEKEKDAMKTKKLSEASINTDKLVGMTILPYYAIPYSLWHQGYCSARDLSELTMTWLLLLAMNPFTGWFFHPFVFGWTQ
ncbi:MAG: hypothetical protein WAM26_18240 [Nitrososphaeraceae archaeon]